MKKVAFTLSLSLLFCFVIEAGAQAGRPDPERIWKNLSRLPQNLRDDLKKTELWKNTEVVKSGNIRLDSTVKYTSFNSGKTFPLNKSIFEYPAAGTVVQSDYVNYGEWVLQKRSTLTLDAQMRAVEMLEEEPDPSGGGLQATTKLNFYWHGKSNTQCDSIFSAVWDDQWQQWIPSYKLYSFFDAQNRESATETYRYAEGVQIVGIREEYQFDAAGDATITRQFIAKDGKWAELGKVESTFDKLHRETARREDILLDGGSVAPVRKLRRNYDAQGNLTLEERAKWNESSREWAPLKSVSRGYDAKKRMEWTTTESYKTNANFQSKVEIFKRRNDEHPEREVHSGYIPKSKSWQVQAETRYYYSK